MDSSRYSIGEKYSNNSERNMTQTQVVRQLQLMGSEMSRSTLANIEVGRRNIKASDLKALKVLFDVDYTAFFRE